MGTIAIRRENKSRYERRAPIAPEQMARAIKEYGVQFVVEPSSVRIFDDGEYANAGGTLSGTFDDAGIVMGVKEIPTRLLRQDQAYLYFSHTIKAQPYNMRMLQRLLDLKCTLLDYELIANDSGQRLVFFGYHAGLAGMIDTLWTVGRRLRLAGHDTAFGRILQALEYDDLEDAKRSIRMAGILLAEDGLPAEMCPFVVGFAGYGNSSRGAQDVCALLPTMDVSPEELPRLFEDGAQISNKHVYRVVFKEEHLARRIADGGFDRQEYFDEPEKYEGIFPQYLPYLRVLMNCIYWEERYPKLVTRAVARDLAAEGRLPLVAIGDITCDIDGSIEMTTKSTDQETPVLLYNPADDTVVESFEGPGVAVVAVDNLPAELPRDATRHFGDSLFPFLPDLANLDRSASFEELNLRPELKQAIVVWNGELTPRFRYLEEAL